MAGLGALLLPAGVAVAKTKTSKCKPHGSRTIDSTTTYRLFRLKGKRNLCEWRTGRVVYRDPERDGGISASFVGAVEEITIGGRFAVFEVVSFSRNEERLELSLLTPSWRSATVYEYAVNEGNPVDSNLQPRVTDIVIRRDGVIAWMAETPEVAGYDGTKPHPRRQVLTVRARQSSARLQPVLAGSGGDVEAGSLALGRSRVYWTQDGQARSARTP